METKTLIIDSREQKPIIPENVKLQTRKLDVGDYTFAGLEKFAVVERKSPNDLYGSIIQGHERFKRELLRAKESGVELCVFVECGEAYFYSKAWDYQHRLKTPGKVLKKILGTMQLRYDFGIVWCDGRKDMKERMMLWLEGKWLKYKK